MERLKLGLRSPAQDSISGNSSSNSCEAPSDHTRVLVRAGSSSNMAKMKEKKPSAMWDKEATNIFCDLCIKEIEVGNRPTTYIIKEGWQNISKRFKELTGREYDRLKFKNKWDQLKKEWRLWKELKQGSTRLGWDPIKRTIDASEEWWTEKLKVVPAAKKFKVCGLDPNLEDKLDVMFKEVVAMGQHALNPSEQVFAGIPVDLPPEQIMGSGEGSGINPRELESTCQSKRPSLKKRRKEKDVFLKSSIDRLIEVFTAPPPTATVDTTIKEFLVALDALPEIVADRTFYLKCVRLLEDPTRRKLFIGMQPELRVEYLRVSIEK